MIDFVHGICDKKRNKINWRLLLCQGVELLGTLVFVLCKSPIKFYISQIYNLSKPKITIGTSEF